MLFNLIILFKRPFVTQHETFLHKFKESVI